MPTWLITRTTNLTTSPEAGRAMTVDTDPIPLGAWLRRERERRRWSRAEMSRRLIKAAEENDDYSMPGINDIVQSIYRWERGTVAPGERYRMYFCHTFGITPDQFGALKDDADVTYLEFKGPVTVSITVRDDGAQVSITSHPRPVAG
jgi:transcriptional regulator with XRE-family HTH domain